MFSNLVKSMLGAALRHLLTTLGGVLVSKGVIDASTANEMVGAGLVLAGVAWSAWQKLGTVESKELLTRILDASHHAIYNTAPSKFTPGDITRGALGAAVALAIIFAMPSPIGNAEAQVLTGHPITDFKTIISKTPLAKGGDPVDRLWTQIMGASLADLQYAKAIADAAGTSGSKARSVCWAAWIDLIMNQSGANAAVNGMDLANAPALFTKFERAAQVADALQINSPFMIACAPVAQSMKMQVISLVAKVAAGGLGLSAIAASGGVVLP